MRTGLDPKLLYHLHIIFEAGSLSAAAEVLTVSQPTLSRAVSQLEAQVGRQLMVRGRNGVVLTETGILLAEQGRRIATDLKQADDVLNALKSDSPPTIRIGAGPLLAHAALNDFVLGMTQTGAPASFDLQIGTARQLISDLLHGRLDLAVMATPPDMRVEHLQQQSADPPDHHRHDIRMHHPDRRILREQGLVGHGHRGFASIHVVEHTAHLLDELETQAFGQRDGRHGDNM